MPGFTIPLNISGFSTLKSEIKAAGKEISALEREVEKARKAGKAVGDDVIKKIGAAEERKRELEAKMKTDGSRLRADEQFGARSERNLEKFNIGGTVGDKLEGFFNRSARGPGALKSILESRALNAVTGGAGAAAVETGATSGLKALARSPLAAIGVGVGAAVVAGKAFAGGLSMFGHYSEEFRKQKADFNVQMADASFVDPLKRELAVKQMRAAENTQDVLGQAPGAVKGVSNFLRGIPLVGGILGGAVDLTLGNAAELGNFARNRAQGLDAFSTLDKELRSTLRETSLGLSRRGRLKDVATSRVYQEKYGSVEAGFLAQQTLGKLKGFYGSNEEAEEVRKKVSEMSDRFDKFTQVGDVRAMKGDFAGAEAAYTEAAKEFSLKKNWRDPLTIWIANDNATKGAVAHAMSQNPLPPLRRGQ